MQNESHNNSPTWKSKLEELESLPGETTPDNNAAWEKLYTRMKGRKPQKNILWYWIAAACILFLFIIPMIVTDKKDDQLTVTERKQHQSEIQQHQQQQPASLAIINRKKDSVAIKHPALPKKNVTIISDKPNELLANNIQESKSEALRVRDTVSSENGIARPVKKMVQAIDTSSYFVSMPAKKTLPVVHVNELDEAVDIPPMVARNSQNLSSHFLKVASQEVHKSSAVSVTKKFATINFKTSPN